MTSPPRRQGAISLRYTLVMLTALSAMNQLDRQLINILIEPIRREFQLSDLQIGFLSGFAFVTVYSLLSIPAAIVAVRHNRRTLLAAAAAIWGALTICCGFAQSYAQLLLARVGVGIGEAGGMPASHAIISDLYPPGQRATAMSSWAAGINGGIFFAFLFGGLIGHAYGWRWALIGAGAVTVLLAIVLQLTVREPPREISGPLIERERPHAAPLVGETLRSMLRDPVLRHVTIGACLAGIVGSGLIAWLPSFLIRSHGLTIASAGTYLAIVIGIGGALGTSLSGVVSDRAGRRDVRWPLWLVAAALIVTKPFAFAFLLVDDTKLALALFAVPACLAGVYIGTSLATLHDRVAPRLRPVASAIFVLLVNFVGMGIGPLAVGAMNDFVFHPFGPDALRYSLIVIQGLAIWGAAHYVRAGHSANAR